MKIKLEIDTDNTAFDGDWREEVGRILGKLQTALKKKYIKSTDSQYIVFDSNSVRTGILDVSDSAWALDEQ